MSVRDPIPTDATHAGGIVFRLIDGEPHYLLIEPKNGSREWLLPKGHIEAGEAAAEAAVREVREETGVDAAIVAPVGSSEFTLHGRDVRVTFFLMAWRGDGAAQEERQARWFAFAEAVAQLTHAENRMLLERAEALRRTGQA